MIRIDASRVADYTTHRQKCINTRELKESETHVLATVPRPKLGESYVRDPVLSVTRISCFDSKAGERLKGEKSGCSQAVEILSASGTSAVMAVWRRSAASRSCDAK